MHLDANATWFTLTVQGGNFAVYSFSDQEEVSKPYEFTIELVSKSAAVDMTAMLDTSACLSITDRSGVARLVHGLLSEVHQLHTANSFTHYRCKLSPRLFFLNLIRDHRIFQNMTVVEIIQKIRKEQGFDDNASEFKVGKKLEPREYCVQYGETDLHFITRICEEEGRFFYFTHTLASHCVCFYDYKGGPAIEGTPDIRFFQGSGQPADTAVIARLEIFNAVNSNAAMYKEWNFAKPKLDLTVKEYESGPELAPAPSGMLLEEYNYPYLYELPEPGKRYAKLQLERQLTFRKWIECQGDVSRLLPGHTFTITEHPRPDVAMSWWIASVRHEGEQPGVLEHEAPGDRGMHYQSSVRAIPAETRYVPQLEHRKNRVIGNQTAIVTLPLTTLPTLKPKAKPTKRCAINAKQNNTPMTIRSFMVNAMKKLMINGSFRWVMKYISNQAQKSSWMLGWNSPSNPVSASLKLTLRA